MWVYFLHFFFVLLLFWPPRSLSLSPVRACTCVILSLSALCYKQEKNKKKCWPRWNPIVGLFSCEILLGILLLSWWCHACICVCMPLPLPAQQGSELVTTYDSLVAMWPCVA
jgi:hypothetical protein